MRGCGWIPRLAGFVVHHLGMKRAQQLPPSLHGRAFTTVEGSATGVSLKRMRGSDLTQPFSGIRAPQGGDDSPRRLIETYSERMSPDQFFSQVTAAIIHGLPLPLIVERDRTLHVCTEHPAARHRTRGIVGHHVEPGTVHIVEVRGLRVTSPVDTWCQLASVLSLDDLIKVGDALVRRKNPLATMEALRAAVLRYAGHRGARKLREAFESVRPGVDSPKETELRLLLVRAGLPEPEVNCAITDHLGLKIATGDLVYRRFRVLVEYDGEQHRTDEEQYHWDVDRLDRIMEEGWRVIRINKSHLRSRPASVLRKVETALRAAGWRP